MAKKPKFSCWGPSFFKVLLDYSNRLRLPPVFVRNYGKFLNGSAELRTNSGKTWNVEIREEIYDDGVEYWCFVGGGWKKFVKDLELQLGEFVFFDFKVDESTFDVSVFGTDCCERRISAMAVKSEADSGLMGGKLCFTAVIGEDNAYTMDIPKDFAAETGIAGKSTVKLQNVKGKEWVVELPIMKYGRNRMSKGWSTFFGENNVDIGSKCLFEFDPTSGNLIVKIEGDFSKTGKERSLEYMRVPGKRGSGRSPKNLLDVEFEPDDDEDDSGTFTGMGRGRSQTTRGRGRGRGRPSKKLLDVEFESDGDEDGSEFITGRGRGRGRPSKNLLDMSDGDENCSEYLTGRGRGRPPKNVLDVEFESDGDEDSCEIFTGKGRGRPHKNSMDVETDSCDDDDDDYSEF